jgi:hypothetical protein
MGTRSRLYLGMKAPNWIASCGLGAFIALGCQGSPDAQPIAATTGGSSPVGSVGGTATGGAAATPPDFQPLGGPAAIACDPATKGLGGRRIWRLTRQQYESTVAALLGDTSNPAAGFSPEPGSAQGFQNDAYTLRVRGSEAAQFQAAARKLAAAAAKGNLARLTPCAATSLSDAACAANLVKDFGRSAFRRPLSDAEHARYLELFQLGTAKRDSALGVEVLVEAMLQSPHFLYRSELGQAPSEGQVRLTEHELAALLSYTFVGGPPDAELAALADASTLSAPGTLAAQARRLLAEPAARPTLWEFYRELFEVTSLADAPKDPSVFPEFEAARADLEASARAFVEHALFEGDSRLGTLLTSTQAFVNQGLSPFFGVGSSSKTLELQTPPDGQHPGILAHPAVLSVLAARTRTSPVNRGRFVRQKLLCERIPDPPAGVDTQLPTPEPGLTARQQLDQKTSGQPCATCHAQMNPLGFGFEKLDGIGRFRSTDNGQPIDDSGSLSGTRDIDGPFQGLGELSQKLSTSAQVQECLSVQAYRYVFGRGESADDACAIAQVRDHFTSAGLNLQELYLAIVATESFGSRKAD